MRLFLACSHDKLNYLEDVSLKHNILISFEYFNFNCVEKLKYLTDKYFIFDSGAFSVWKSGKNIDFNKYLQVWNKLEDTLGDKLIVINLDVIPGQFGKLPTAKDISSSCEQSFKNYLYMKKHLKCKIMPVFHQHDNFNYLHKYMQEKVFLLGLSPANDLSTKQRMPWLNKCFAITRHIQRCHGLAATSYQIMSTYPFYSCDSASWQIKSGFGSVSKWNGKKMETIHYTDKDLVIKHNLSSIIDNRNNKDIKYANRYRINIKSYIEMSIYLNNLWKQRGVIWND